MKFEITNQKKIEADAEEVQKLRAELRAMREVKEEKKEEPKIKMINYRLNKQDNQGDEYEKLVHKRAAMLKGGMYKETDSLIMQIDKQLANLEVRREG